MKTRKTLPNISTFRASLLRTFSTSLLCTFMFGACLLSSCSDQTLKLSSSDKSIEATFAWAQGMAQSYAHEGEDPVGPWYEAALPERYAFCMRDASHQSIGAEILGLSAQNFNMMQKFASNISESKDWCTYWEIDKWNNPCKADYVSDNDFWYNLNANFDVIDACWRLYEWTGDQRYLANEEFRRFYDLSCNEYVESWELKPEQMLTRSRKVNRKDGERFGLCRGIPSYVESVGDMNSSADFIGTAYGGFAAYSKILEQCDEMEGSALAAEKAEAYRHHLDKYWWSEEEQAYHTFWWNNGTFSDGEGLTHVLWFHAVNAPSRIRGTVEKMMKRKEWNIENISYFPALWYRYGYSREAYEILCNIVHAERKEYPEVSFGMIEGIVCGCMGIQPSASSGKIVTLPQIVGEHWIQIDNLPVYDGLISVRHDSNTCSSFTNKTGYKKTWQAAFYGDYEHITVDGKQHQALKRQDAMGKTISYVEVTVGEGQSFRCEAGF